MRESTTSNKNQHGLSRDLPASIERAVRERCGFGCVICGAIPFEYDHLTVPFADAKEHVASDIVLLCSEHHDKKTRGMITAQEILRIMHTNSPRERPFVFHQDVTAPTFGVHWPSSIALTAVRSAILVDGADVFELKTQSASSENVLLSARFSDFSGNEVCAIRDNKFIGHPSAVLDFECRKNRFRYKAQDGRVVLSFSVSSDGVRIDEMFYVHKDAFVFANEQTFRVGNAHYFFDFQVPRYASAALRSAFAQLK